MPNQIKSMTSSNISSCIHQLIMLLQLQLVPFVLLYLTTVLHCSDGSSSVANNINQHFVNENSSRLVTVDQLSANALMDLTGSVDEGTYRVTLKLGSHSQEYYFVIDTGSDLTWVNCHNNRSEYHYPHQAYNPPTLNTVLCGDPICHHVEQPSGFRCNHSTDSCHYIVNYIDHTFTRGVVILDSLALPFRDAHRPLPHPSIKIGCGFHQHHPSGTISGHTVTYDGILGLAKKSSASILQQLASNGIIQPVFGHCMAYPKNGYFFIGSGRVLPSAITWAPMVTLHHDEDQYSPGRANLLFNGRPTSVMNIETVFDSGSTISYFKTSALRAIITHVKANLVLTVAPLSQIHIEGYPICWRGLQPIRSVDEVAMFFKTMTLVFPVANNARFELPPYTYLLVEPRDNHSDAGDVCFGIHDGADLGLGEQTRIGGIFFQNKLVVYDIQRERIGWAPSNCHYRGMNDHKLRDINNHNYRNRDLFKHEFRTIHVQPQPPSTNYTTVEL